MNVDPFPHLVMEGAWPDAVLDDVVTEFPPPSDPRWKRYANEREAKLEGNDGIVTTATPATCMILASLGDQRWRAELADKFGIDDELHCEIDGGGMHLIPPGGHLAVHADFNRSHVTGRYRRLNLLIYLNRGWRNEWGGHLELHDERGPVASYAPRFNRTVVFETSDRSWHGHPSPLACPPDRCRRSLAAYYFSDSPPPDVGDAHSTVWKDPA